MKSNKKAEIEKNVVNDGKVKKKKVKNSKQLNGENITKETTLDNENLTKVINAPEVNKGKVKKNKLKKSKQLNGEDHVETLDNENQTKAIDAPQEVKKSEVQNKNMTTVNAPTNEKVQGNKPKKTKNKIADTEKTPNNQNGEISTDLENTKKKNKKQNKKSKVNSNNEAQRKDPAPTEQTVFVGNLPINTKRVQLIKLFDKYKPIHSIRIRTADGRLLFKHKNRKETPSLIAFVAFTSVDNARKSLELNGTKFKDNHLRITLASDKDGSDNVKRTIFVGNLKYSATDEKLREIFSSCGEIEYVRCLQDGKNGCKGVAYVCFKSPESVGLAIELNETLLDERPIHVERYTLKKLGAKKAREGSAASEKKVIKGAQKRLNDKKKNPGNNTAQNANEKKKSEFRGVKIDSNKKKQKQKKKNLNEREKLAKKIAPKSK